MRSTIQNGNKLRLVAKRK